MNDTLVKMAERCRTQADRDALAAEILKFQGAALEAVRALNCSRALVMVPYGKPARSFGEIADSLARFV